MLGSADRNQGGVGDLAYPLVSDLKREIVQKYNVLTPDGVALRGLFIIDKEVILYVLSLASPKTKHVSHSIKAASGRRATENLNCQAAQLHPTFGEGAIADKVSQSIALCSMA